MKKAREVAPATIITEGSTEEGHSTLNAEGSTEEGHSTLNAEGSTEEGCSILNAEGSTEEGRSILNAEVSKVRSSSTDAEGSKVECSTTDAEGPTKELAATCTEGSKFENATTDAKGVKAEEEEATVYAEGVTARICPSYRLLVWLVLCLGYALSLMGVSTLSVVLSCRSLHIKGRRSESSTNNLTRQKWIMWEPPRRNSSLPGWNSTRGEGKQTRSGSGARTGSTVTESVDSPMNSPRSSTGKNASDKPTAGSFRSNHAWAKMTEAWVTTLMLVGGDIFQVPSGVLSVYVGARRVSIVATCVFIVTQALSVPAIYWGPVATGIVCFVKGAACGALYPALTLLASNWCGSTETSLVISVVNSGYQIGHGASYLAGFVFCDDGEGWTRVFYQEAAVGVLFGMGLYLVVQERVTAESRIACLPAAERHFLTAALQVKGISSEKVKVPYRSILTSLPVIALIVFKAGHEWLECLVITSLPHSLAHTQYMDIRTVRQFTCIGLLLSIPVAVVGAKVADYMMASPRFNPSTVRKLFGILSSGFPALCFLALILLEVHHEALVMTLYLTGISFSGLVDSTWPANCLDLAPAFAGLLTSLAEASTSWLWVVCVMTVAHMAPQDTAEQWRSVLYLTVAILFASTLFYVLFASGVKQAWADPQPKAAA